jgi:DNA adenine methylase
MTTYKAIKSDAEEVIRRLKRMKNVEDFFYRVRARKIDDKDMYDIAAWYIYQNKTPFNGLYRVNKKNEFNAPFGSYKNPTICDAENLIACSAALRNTKLLSTQFHHVMGVAKKGDFVYLDPPYLQRVGNEFVSYGVEHFDLDAHTVLRDCATDLKERGVHVLISNSGADPIQELYSKPWFKVREVRGRRSVGAHASTRGTLPDLLIW